MTTEGENWRPVVGCEGSYEISDLGRVRSLERIIKRRYREGFRFQLVKSAILRPSLATPYPSVTLLDRKMRKIHTMVLEAFIGPRPSGRHEGLHGDGDRTNNKLSNLRWGTSKENKDDAIKHGIWAHGETCGLSKLDDSKVMAIRSSKNTPEYFGLKFGVAPNTIRKVRLYKTWRHLP